MKNFSISLLAAILIVALYAFLLAPKFEDEVPEPPKKIETKPIVVTLIQQNSAPNYRMLSDTLETIFDESSDAPDGWKIVSRVHTGDIIIQ